MVTVKESQKRNVNGRELTNFHAIPGNNLVAVDHGIRSKGAWKLNLVRVGPTVFLAATTALVAWTVGTRVFVDVHKRRNYQDEISQRLHDFTRVGTPPQKSTLRKALVMQMSDRG